jgi:hypothetical protein
VIVAKVPWMLQNICTQKNYGPDLILRIRKEGEKKGMD